jgi:hypothetical protein
MRGTVKESMAKLEMARLKTLVSSDRSWCRKGWGKYYKCTCTHISVEEEREFMSVLGHVKPTHVSCVYKD